MKFDGNWYTETANLYLRFLRLYSPNAVNSLYDILRTHGAEAAYRAAFALIQMKNELQRSSEIINAAKYEQRMNDYPDALPVFRRALHEFMNDYRNVDTEKGARHP